MTLSLYIRPVLALYQRNIHVWHLLFDTLVYIRPVLALYDIDTMKVEDKKKEQKLQEVVACQGPPDGTVIVSVEAEEMEQDLVEAIVHFFSDVGEIVLVR